jgi:mannose-6-phosphate isomerase-like protein (cupin superfamily)
MIKSCFAFVFICFYVVVMSCNNKSSKENPVVTKDTTTPVVKHLSILQEDSILNAAPKDTANTISLGTAEVVSNGQGGEGYYLIRRIVSGYVELHEQWDDVAIIRSGHGVLKTGTAIKGDKKSTGEGNWFGNNIENESERNISPGDFITIPATTAHQYIPAKGDTLVYWTIKIKRVH